MRAYSFCCAVLLIGGCSEEVVSDQVEPTQTVDVAALVETAVAECANETANADQNLIPGANEVCLAEKANAAPLLARAAICSEAKAWAGFMDDEICYIDAE
ncbi:hypothetical protein VCJ71_04975 [Alteriqipengyuania sp. WL0013]|uniref:hypothetical protein n=1 Tax=Alteriqipengyuania sp. WL0013 TaxID=3110773 RepID=UPI002B79A53A|nr:hypothetical protein [Alteriqipengyuania sp. WL0013]MEB3415410.1 hypothetical protein [Alteriqipengyuania sp. WL0013]